MTQSFFEKFARFASRIVLRHYIMIFLAAAVLAAVAFPRASRFFTSVDTDLTKLLPENFKSVQVINDIRDKFRSSSKVIVVVENTDPAGAKKFSIDLQRYLETDPEINNADLTKPGYEFFDKHKLLFIDLEDLRTIRDRIDRRIQREKLGGLFVDFEDEDSETDANKEFKFGDLNSKYKAKYSPGVRSPFNVNDTGTIYSIHTHPKHDFEGIKGNREFLAHMKDLVGRFQTERGDTSTKIYYGGGVRTRVDEYNTIIRDLSRAGIISGIGIFLILLVYFRRVASPVLIFTPLTMGILISFAFSSLFIDSLNLVTSFLFAILGGLGVEVGIHMMARYIEERHRALSQGKPRDEAVENALFATLYHTGASAFTSAATVAATFFVLIVNDFKGFSEFGFIAGFGLVFNYLIYFFVFPSVLVIAEKLKLLSFKRGFGFDSIGGSDEVVPKRARRFPMPRFTLVGMGVLALLTFYSLPRVDFEWRFSKIKANTQGFQEAKKKQRETAVAVNSPAAVVIRGKEDAKALKEAIDKIKEKAGTNNVVQAFKSYYDLSGEDQDEKLDVIGDMKKLLSDKTLKLVKGEYKKDLDDFKAALAETEKITEEKIPSEVREIFKGNSGNPDFEIAYINPDPNLELDDGLNAIHFAEQIEKIETSAGTFYPSSDSIVFADVLRTMIRDGKRVVFFAFAIVFIIVWIDFRSVRDALLVISPIALGILFTFAIMYVLKLRLNFYNIVVIPTAVGTSIDNSIHLLHRYHELGRGSIIAALKSSGSAALTSSLTNIFGFLGLVFCSHNGLRSIGDLAVAGLIACLLTTLVFFPALLQWLEDRSKKNPIEA